MNNEQAAYPIVLPHAEADYCKGLTKLEYFTAMAMQGMLANPGPKPDWETFAKEPARVAQVTLLHLQNEQK